MNRNLHIVCLDVPWPADYGGAIDMMNRVRSLHQAGVGIHLHYFSYNDRGTPNELNQYCAAIHVYERKPMKDSLPLRMPYIVSSRISQELIDNLKKDDHPILLEGIHCTGILPYIDRSSRKIVVRVHNDESIYYRELARAEHQLSKKLFFYNESRLLKRYTHSLPEECRYVCLSEKDQWRFEKKYNLPQADFLPIYPSWQEIRGEQGRGGFCLYHGNLSVPENEKAALWLICKVFTKTRLPFVIAGKKPGRRLKKVAELCQHTCLIADPSETEMNDLVRKAHINVLPCFNKDITGIRLKLLHALYEGRHCIVNEPMVAGTGLEGACHIGTGANAFASILSQLYYQPFEEEELRLRKELLANTYDNDRNTRQLIQWLW